MHASCMPASAPCTVMGRLAHLLASCLSTKTICATSTPCVPQPLVWNAGDGRCKLITVATRAPVPVPVRQSEDKAGGSRQASSSSAASSSSGTLGTKAAEGEVGTSSGAPGGSMSQPRQVGH